MSRSLARRVRALERYWEAEAFGALLRLSGLASEGETMLFLRALAGEALSPDALAVAAAVGDRLHEAASERDRVLIWGK